MSTKSQEDVDPDLIPDEQIEDGLHVVRVQGCGMRSRVLLVGCDGQGRESILDSADVPWSEHSLPTI